MGLNGESLLVDQMLCDLGAAFIPFEWSPIRPQDLNAQCAQRDDATTGRRSVDVRVSVTQANEDRPKVPNFVNLFAGTSTFLQSFDPHMGAQDRRHSKMFHPALPPEAR